jgi:hypothetical protein
MKMRLLLGDIVRICNSPLKPQPFYLATPLSPGMPSFTPETLRFVLFFKVTLDVQTSFMRMQKNGTVVIDTLGLRRLLEALRYAHQIDNRKHQIKNGDGIT